MKQLLCISYILYSMTSVASEKSFVELRDGCSNQKTNTTTPNGSVVYAKVSKRDLPRSLKFVLKLTPYKAWKKNIKTGYVWKYEITPLNAREWMSRGRRNTTVNFDQNYYYIKQKLPRISKLARFEKLEGQHFGQLWNISLEIQDRASKEIQTLNSHFFRVDFGQKFFRLTKPSFCFYEKEVEITSKVYRNDLDDYMNITKEYFWHQISGLSRGVDFGFYGFDANSFLTTFSGDHFGWIYKEVQSSYENRETEMMSRRWVLNRNEKGVFASRKTTYRSESELWQWDQDSSSCGEYVKTAEGVLDITKKSEDMYVIPDGLSTQEEMKDFVMKVRPNAQGCNEEIDYYDEVIINKNDESLYGFKEM